MYGVMSDRYRSIYVISDLILPYFFQIGFVLCSEQMLIGLKLYSILHVAEVLVPLLCDVCISSKLLGVK